MPPMRLLTLLITQQFWQAMILLGQTHRSAEPYHQVGELRKRDQVTCKPLLEHDHLFDKPQEPGLVPDMYMPSPWMVRFLFGYLYWLPTNKTKFQCTSVYSNIPIILDISMQDYDDRYITSDTSVSISLVGQTRIGLFSLAHCATPLQKASTSSIFHQNICSLE